jgi:multidrug efflux system membrane fusion protein
VSARNITLGPTEGERVAVTSGLNPGDRVVVDGADRLKDGLEVIVQDPAAPVDVPRRRRRDGAGAGPDGAQRPARQSGGQE